MTNHIWYNCTWRDATLLPYLPAPAAEQNISAQQVSISPTITLLNIRWSILEATELPSSVPAALPACSSTTHCQVELSTRPGPGQPLVILAQAQAQAQVQAQAPGAAARLGSLARARQLRPVQAGPTAALPTTHSANSGTLLRRSSPMTR
jgi:hypothetical protein